MLPSDVVRTWSKNIRAGLNPEVSSLAMDLIQDRNVNKTISCSIIRLVEGAPQVQKIITETSLKANSLYCQQLMLLDPTHWILRPFVSRCYLSNSIVKKALFSLPSCRAKGKPVQALSSSSISLQCSSALVVPLLLRPSSDSVLLDINSPYYDLSSELRLYLDKDLREEKG